MVKLGIKEYEDMYDCMKHRLGEIYYEIEENTRYSQLGLYKWCTKKFSSYADFNRYMNIVPFKRETVVVSLKMFIKARYVIRQYEKYKKVTDFNPRLGE